MRIIQGGRRLAESELEADRRGRDALSWLFSLADQERGVGWNPAASPAEQWKLGRTRALLDLAGAPDRSLPCVLIAGTKGKGSTAAFLASILHAAGVRAGLYTKPHLQSYRERIRVDGVALDAETLTVAVEQLRERVAELRRRSPEAGPPTTFEVTTALALAHFAHAGCRVAVVEVGLGGRLDATNAVDPAVAAITPISRDHTAILGGTLAAIAREKAGVLRRGVPALLAYQRPTAARALAAACRSVGAACEWVAPLPAADGGTGAGESVVLGDRGGARRVRLGLLGQYQRQNAALAVAAAGHLVAAGLPIPEEAVVRGLEELRWPGRFEVIPGRPTVVLDGAHNDASAEALAAELRAYARGRRIHLVVGVNRDKEARAVLRPLLREAASAWVAGAAGSARAMAPADLAALCRHLASRPVHEHASVANALEDARGNADAGDVVCVTGSLVVVGEARDALGLPPLERLWPEP